MISTTGLLTVLKSSMVIEMTANGVRRVTKCDNTHSRNDIGADVVSTPGEVLEKLHFALVELLLVRKS